MVNTVYSVDIPLTLDITVYSALRAEAYVSRSAYRLYVKGYVSALRDLGANEESVSALYEAFLNAEDEIFFDEISS